MVRSQPASSSSVYFSAPSSASASASASASFSASFSISFSVSFSISVVSFSASSFSFSSFSNVSFSTGSFSVSFPFSFSPSFSASFSFCDCRGYLQYQELQNTKRSEWNSLKEHDVLFLLCIRPSFEPLSAEEAAKATVPQRLGFQYVRGCEVIDICDEEGNLMNDFTGRVKRDEWKPPKGEMRTVTVALDAAQYHIDVTDIAEKGAEDVYGTFNVLMRRKPKENNFKAILESIRDLMNEYCIVPEWLHNVFLGYGNPSAAQWPNMPNLLKTVEVSFVSADGAEVLDPRPPFRITLPKTLKGNINARSGNEKSEANPPDTVDMVDVSPREKLVVEAYTPPDPGLILRTSRSRTQLNLHLHRSN